MIIGIPREIKVQEYRVGLTPAGAKALCEDGHRVIVETLAGSGSGFTDQAYRDVGAEIIASAAELYATADLVVKVKEPQSQEVGRLRQGQLLFTFLHLAPEPLLTDALLNSGCTAIAYETITDDAGSLPLLMPMSEIAGRMAPQIGAHYLQKENGGKGLLLAGAPGVRAGHVVILGAGTVGSNALRIAVGMGADVTIFDINPQRLAQLDDHYGNRIHTLAANSQTIEEEVQKADLLIGAVLTVGARAPQLVSRELVASMEPGSVIVDVAVDQGGCIATTRPTTHANPVYEDAGVLHYGVANMPGAVSRTSTWALTNSTLPYVRQLAASGLQAIEQSCTLRQGLNVHAGLVTNRAVADSLGLAYTPLPEKIKI